jgi:hypothetical protein
MIIDCYICINKNYVDNIFIKFSTWGVDISPHNYNYIGKKDKIINLIF